MENNVSHNKTVQLPGTFSLSHPRLYLIGRLLKLGFCQSYFSVQTCIYMEMTELVVIALWAVK